MKYENRKEINFDYVFISKTPIETGELGEKIGKLLRPGNIIALNGQLGAGKTCLIKGIAKGLKSDNDVTSPSFSLINEYIGDYPIYHFDFYRINNPEEIETLGYEEYFYGTGVTLIEWAEKIEKYLPDELVLIDIKIEENSYYRKFYFRSIGEYYYKMIKALKKDENIRN
ncbi:MAG: tRNA (adenosine(37)-N6)-threonylcarbamoyltransferase complex ATPase subunit type 1 TsaE [Atribacterota bacterium]|nr:tRNA (adenosine(37)-N6)-threonylcarbamoyltransferase complex ATPase subunit type 1 TsaE [Atribacterota bacterium]